MDGVIPICVSAARLNQALEFVCRSTKCGVATAHGKTTAANWGSGKGLQNSSDQQIRSQAVGMMNQLQHRTHVLHCPAA